MPAAPSIKITTSEFDQIERKSEDLPLVAYCDHSGVHTLVGLAADFHVRLMPRLDQSLVVKLKGLALTASNKEVVVHKSPRGQCSVKTKSVPKKWKPLPPPTGMNPLMIATGGCLDRENISIRMLYAARQFFQGPICIFGDPWVPLHDWRDGIRDGPDMLAEPKEKLEFLLTDNKGQEWLRQAVELAKDAGAVFIGGDSYDGKAEDDDLLAGLRDYFQPHAPVYLLPSYEYDGGCEKRWASFWDHAMRDLERFSQQ